MGTRVQSLFSMFLLILNASSPGNLLASSFSRLVPLLSSSQVYGIGSSIMNVLPMIDRQLLGRFHCIVRTTRDIEPLLRFYREGLGLKISEYGFEWGSYTYVKLRHDLSDYVFHFIKQGVVMGQNPLFRDTYFVLYAATEEAQNLIAGRMYAAGYRAVDHDSVTRAGGYGARFGCLVFEDPDGYRVILDHTGDLPFGGISPAAIATYLGDN